MKTFFENIWTFLVDRFTGRNAKNFEVRDRVMTVPNMVTMAGVLLTFVYIVLLFLGTATVFIPALVIFIVLTDALDGYLADRLNQHSKYGKVLDPFRDRFFTLALLYNLVLIGGVGIVFPVIVLIWMELGLVLYYRERYLLTGKILEVHWLGKARSAMQWLLGFGILVQFYWFGAVYFSPVFLLYLMAGASIALYVRCHTS